MPSHEPDHLVRHTYAIVLAGGRGTRLAPLTDHCAKPAVPFAGKLRIIDFTLSNCVNSGLRRIGVLTQYKAQSLIRHVERGWGFLPGRLGEFIEVVPAQQQQGEGWYSGTANAVFQNLDLVREAAPRHVLVLGGDHVYKMDYSVMLAEHVARGAAASVACIEVPLDEACEFGVMAVDGTGRITAFAEKPERPQPVPGRPGWALASMGIYLFDADVLVAALERDAADARSRHDFGHDVIPALLHTHRVFAHAFETSCVNRFEGRPYWRDVGAVDTYWAANMDLTRLAPELDLYDDHWPVFSLQRQLPPAKFVLDHEGRRGAAVDSLVSGGCIVSGATVRRSILFSKVHVAEGSVIEDSLVLPNTTVGRGVRLVHTVVDRDCHLPDGFRAGQDVAADRARGLHVTPGGITVVTAAMLCQAAQTCACPPHGVDAPLH